jgi:hypothetical protein
LRREKEGWREEGGKREGRGRVGGIDIGREGGQRRWGKGQRREEGEGEGRLGSERRKEEGGGHTKHRPVSLRIAFNILNKTVKNS